MASSPVTKVISAAAILVPLEPDFGLELHCCSTVLAHWYGVMPNKENRHNVHILNYAYPNHQGGGEVLCLCDVRAHIRTLNNVRFSLQSTTQSKRKACAGICHGQCCWACACFSLHNLSTGFLWDATPRKYNRSMCATVHSTAQAHSTVITI
jgi:hypothetical protein